MPASPSPDDPDKVLDLNGDWKQTNAESPDAWQAATIADGMITILWVSDGGDTTTLYWAGSFDAPTEKGGTYSWTSKNDHGQTDGAAQGSKEDTTKFSYADGVLSYSVTVDDEATTVELGRYKRGDLVVIVAGAPPGTVGSTNLIHVHRIGEDDH